MEIIYKNRTVQKQFDPAFRKKWKYPKPVIVKLLAMENIIRSAPSLRDIVNNAPLHFHPLQGGREDEWSLYVGGTGYRVTIVPCSDEGSLIPKGEVISQCGNIKIVMVTEVSNHYE